MQLNDVAKALKELGHPTRLLIFKNVVKAGLQGVPVGSIQQQLAVPNSTLSHHIAGLVSAGLINQRRESRTLYCVADYSRLQDVIVFLQDECCADDPCFKQPPK